MTSRRCDVLVAGGGLVGLSLAPALARAGLAVALVDRAPVAAPATDPATLDSRVYAISPSSVAFLEAQRAWPAVPAVRLQPVESMRIEGDRGALLEFSAYDVGVRALAWIAEEREIRRALVPQVADAGVEVLAPQRFGALSFAPTHATLELDGAGAIEARLVVGADGIRSRVREAAGMHAEPRPYGQTAVVANFACEHPHRGCARQWFRPDGGILAWLPLPGRRISIVWSAPTALATELMTLDHAALAARVADAGLRALGDLEVVTPPAAFPLQFLRLPAPVAHRLALVGDAAHGVHPLAGQGVNLGFGDAEALAAVVATRGPVADPGAAVLLERYARRRAEPVLAMQALTDGLARLFGAQGTWLALLRNLGLGAADRLPFVKQALAQHAVR